MVIDYKVIQPKKSNQPFGIVYAFYPYNSLFVFPVPK